MLIVGWKGGAIVGFLLGLAYWAGSGELCLIRALLKICSLFGLNKTAVGALLVAIQ